MPLSSDDIARLYRQKARGLAVFFMRRTHDSEATLDLVAETFARVVHHRRRCRGTTEHEREAWLWAIANNVLNGWYRRGAVERRAIERIGIATVSWTDTEIERLVELAGLEQSRARVGAELAGLPSTQREAVTLRVVDERSYEDIAALLGVSEQTVRARVSRGLRALAEAIDRPIPSLEECRG